MESVVECLLRLFVHFLVGNLVAARICDGVTAVQERRCPTCKYFAHAIRAHISAVVAGRVTITAFSADATATVTAVTTSARTASTAWPIAVTAGTYTTATCTRVTITVATTAYDHVTITIASTTLPANPIAAASTDAAIASALASATI